MSSSYALAVAIFGGFAPLIAQWLIETTGSPLAPVSYVMAAAAVSFVVIFAYPGDGACAVKMERIANSE